MHSEVFRRLEKLFHKRKTQVPLSIRANHGIINVQWKLFLAPEIIDYQTVEMSLQTLTAARQVITAAF